MTHQHPLQLSVNGDSYHITVEARTTLADALRDECQLTGTHLGCEHGVCGACTILVNGQPMRSCLMFAVQADGASIRTVEGLAADEHTLHPAQQAFWDAHALQCGFCTPGFLCLLVGFLEQNPEADVEQIRDVLSSNLCRCTGYQNIVAAALTTQRRLQALGEEPGS